MREFVMLLLSLMLFFNVPFAATASQEEDPAYSNSDYEAEPREEVYYNYTGQEGAEYEGVRDEGYEAAGPSEAEEQDEEQEGQ